MSNFVFRAGCEIEVVAVRGDSVNVLRWELAVRNGELLIGSHFCLRPLRQQAGQLHCFHVGEKESFYVAVDSIVRVFDSIWPSPSPEKEGESDE